MYVSNIHPNLQESDIRELFENFGKILDFALRKENGKGVATIQYANGENARTARETLNGKEICGMKINISMSLQNVIEKIGNDELDEKSGVALDNTSRVQLMQRLAGNIPSEQSQVLFHFILFIFCFHYFILFYFILFYFILFYFILCIGIY